MRRSFALMLIAGIFFASVSLLINGFAQQNRFPHLMRQNPWGFSVWNAVPDADDHHPESVQFAEQFFRREWRPLARGVLSWSGDPAKFYWLCYALFGTGPVSTIPLNTGLYLLILALVYQIGRRVWNARTGFWTAAVVGLWPSSLLHLTQPVKDPFFIAGQLLLLLSAVRIVQVEHRRGIALWSGLALLGFLVCRTVRPHVVIINLPIWLLVVAWLTARFCRRRAVSLAAVAAAAVLGIMLSSSTIALTSYPAAWTLPVTPSPTTSVPAGSPWLAGQAVADGAMQSQTVPVTAAPAPAAPLLLLRRVSHWLAVTLTIRRYEWAHGYPEAKANLDLDVDFSNQPWRIFAHLPRALQVGFLAPFPSMWFEQGKRVGLSGRLLIGAEMMGMYLLMPLALWGFWRSRRPESWLLMLFVLLGVTLLGLVVTNVGALYRMRYAFWFILMPPAIEGWLSLKDRLVVRLPDTTQEELPCMH